MTSTSPTGRLSRRSAIRSLDSCDRIPDALPGDGSVHRWAGGNQYARTLGRTCRKNRNREIVQTFAVCEEWPCTRGCLLYATHFRVQLLFTVQDSDVVAGGAGRHTQHHDDRESSSEVKQQKLFACDVR